MTHAARIALLATLALTTASVVRAEAPAVAARTASVREDGGTIVYQSGERVVRLPGAGHDSMPALSPDGDRVVFVREGKARRGHEASPPTELWLHEMIGAGAERRLLAERRSEISERTQTGFNNPVFSADGDVVYVLGHAWVTSDVVLAVVVATGKARFVVDGNSIAVVRTGPYRGDLLVARHKYNGPEIGGSYDPVDLVTPAGKLVLTIPGSADDQDGAPAQWLKAHGWTAS